MFVWRSVPRPVIHRFAAPLMFADATTFRDHVPRLPHRTVRTQAVSASHFFPSGHPAEDAFPAGGAPDTPTPGDADG